MKFFENRKLRKEIEKKMKILIRELKLFDSLYNYPEDITVKKIEYGYEVRFSIAGLCSFSKLDDKKEFIKGVFQAEDIEVICKKGYVTLLIYTKKLNSIDYRKVECNNKQLLLGYNYKNPILVDMDICPHLLIAGLPNMGKSKCTSILLKNIDDADVIILNGYRRDYKGFSCITDIKMIEAYLTELIEKKKVIKRPLYVVIEEMQLLASNKKISDLCKSLLSAGRHLGRGVYIIGIIQIANKENCKFKDLFGNRVCFRQIEKSSYEVCLGMDVDEELMQREFVCYGSCGLVRGHTYNIS